jgi:serine/threonine-protein kinase
MSPNEEVVLELLERLMDEGGTPQEVCAGRPDLVEEVRRRWERVRAMSQEVEALFPARGVAAVFEDADRADVPTIPGYEAVERIGSGGMGVVYRARHVALGRTVAIKMLRPGALGSAREREALRDEAAAVANLAHPGVVQVFDIGEWHGRAYFTMEFLEGGSLAARTGGAPLRPAVAAELTARVAQAVQAAHERGIVHRDLKPGNVLFTRDGDPKITDFGLARRMVGDGASGAEQRAMGTPSYMAPEQARGSTGWAAPPVDVYALGAILYELLTGRPPFRADSPAETQRQVIEEEPAPVSSLNARVPRDLETICHACLRKDRARRYTSARGLADDLGRYLRGEPISARPVGALERVRKWAWRRPGQVAAALVATVGVSVASAGVLWVLSQRWSMERAAEEDLDQAVRLQLRSQWRASRDMLERASTKLASMRGANELRGRAEVVRDELNLVERLRSIRFERAAADETRFDRAAWWSAYEKEFQTAGLLLTGDDPEAFGARVGACPARAALVNAMDDWATCATDKGKLEMLLGATRRADPDPAWRDSARDVAVWLDRGRLEALAARADVASEPVPLLLIIAGLLEESNSEQSMAFLRRVHDANPDDFWAAFAMGEALTGRGDPQGVGYYRAALALQPDAVAAHVNLAVALANLGRLDEAIDHAERALRIRPGSAVARYNVSTWLLRVGRYAEAEEHARRAIELGDDQPLAHAVRGHALARLGRAQEAAGALRTALESGALEPEARGLVEEELRRCIGAAADGGSRSP